MVVWLLGCSVRVVVWVASTPLDSHRYSVRLQPSVPTTHPSQRSTEMWCLSVVASEPYILKVILTVTVLCCIQRHIRAM